MTPTLKAACRSYISASRSLAKYQREHGIVIHDAEHPHVKHWRAAWGIVEKQASKEMTVSQFHRLSQRIHAITVLGGAR